MFFLIFLISYLTTSLINPGIPTREYYSRHFIKNNPDLPSSSVVKCSRCNIVVPKHFRISHCNTCQVCVKNYDHHCPWTGKCIAKNNIVFFYIFITSILLSFSFFVFALTYAASKYEKKRKKKF